MQSPIIEEIRVLFRLFLEQRKEFFILLSENIDVYSSHCNTVIGQQDCLLKTISKKIDNLELLYNGMETSKKPCDEISELKAEIDCLYELIDVQHDTHMMFIEKAARRHKELLILREKDAN